MNVNHMKTQISLKIKYDFKGHGRSHYFELFYQTVLAYSSFSLGGICKKAEC